MGSYVSFHVYSLVNYVLGKEIDKNKERSKPLGFMGSYVSFHVYSLVNYVLGKEIDKNKERNLIL